MLRYKADILSVFYMIVTTALLIVNWNLPQFNVWLFLGSILMATSCFAMAHNHNHIPMWRVDFLNKLTDYWLTLFYGFPVYAWIPTHNMNHHQLNNREGDYTITWRLSEKNNFLTMITFPIISAIYQQQPTSNFLKHYWNTNKPKFFYYISQYVVWGLWIGGAFYLNPRKALLYVAIPMIVATQFVLIINYIQHVHTDEESQYNHSRNFTGIYNKFLLNNGLHTAHHEQMGLHWSQLPEAHAKIAHSVVELEEQGYDVWGTELVLQKEDAYPIKTYVEFEMPDEERQVDPMSVFLEFLGKLKQGEIVGIQILIAPEGPEWTEHWEHLVEKLQESKKKEKKAVTGEGLTESFSSFTVRTPGQTDVLKGVERNLSKQAFETLIRFVYFSPKTIFYDSFARRAITGAFNQYATLDMNRFGQNHAVSTRTKIYNFPYVFPNLRNEYRKRRLIFNFRHRQPPPETAMGRVITSNPFNWNTHTHWFSMTTDCLATVFHPPTFLVLTAPHMQRSESRKVAPPAGLAIYGDESDLPES